MAIVTNNKVKIQRGGNKKPTRPVSMAKNRLNSLVKNPIRRKGVRNMATLPYSKRELSPIIGGARREEMDCWYRSNV